jgi:hypothetical protein
LNERLREGSTSLDITLVTISVPGIGDLRWMTISEVWEPDMMAVFVIPAVLELSKKIGFSHLHPEIGSGNYLICFGG